MSAFWPTVAYTASKPIRPAHFDTAHRRTFSLRYGFRQSTGRRIFKPVPSRHHETRAPGQSLGATRRCTYTSGAQSGADMTLPRFMACLCGTVSITLNGEPQAKANCHCGTCRDFYGTPMLSATAWLAEQVEVTRGSVSTYSHPTKKLSRAFCSACGETVFGTNRLGMRVVPNGIVARASEQELPEEMQPTMHLFYRHRTIDIQDELPKYLDGWDGPTY